MTLVFIARSATTRASVRRLLGNATTNHNNNVLSSRTIRALSSSHLSSTKRPSKQQSRTKDWNIAVASGVLLVASYVTLSNNLHYLSSDTGNGGGSIRSLSSSSKGSQQVQSSQSSSSSKLYLLSDEEVTRRLRANEESYNVNRSQGVVRYDISQLASNSPIEDDRSESIITVPLKQEAGESDFYFWGIYDGHSGPYTSAKLREELIGSVVNELGLAFKVDESNPTIRLQPDSDTIDYCIKQGFLKLDQEIVQESLRKLLKDPFVKDNVMNALPAASGACGLLTFYNAATQDLKVAVTGDSRAVLGSLNEQGEWTAKSLSVDQTGDNPEEVDRILSQHPPNEKSTAVRNGRVLGSLQPTRAFGDFRYKLKEIDGFKIEDLPDHLKVYFRAPPKQLLTPPYVTAEPVVSTTKVNPGKNDFLVIGSDGLYEMLSNEEIVGLVVRWLEKNPLRTSAVATATAAATAASSSCAPSTTSGGHTKDQDPSQWKKLFQSSTDDHKLPKVQDISDARYRDIQRPAFRNKKNHSEHEYLLEDSNVSTHLIRNALSLGGSKEYVSTLVSIPSSKSRRYRDDLTVTVVFFGEQLQQNLTEADRENGGVVVNLQGTKGGKLQEKL